MNERDHVRRNRSAWNRDSDEYQAKHAAMLNDGVQAWGVWQIPERELNVLGDVRGKRLLELGCGGAQWSIQLCAAGAQAVGLDLSERQLGHARRLMGEAGQDVPLVHASAEDLPFRGESFDVVFCDYGAMLFADPYRTVPEAARVLRPGGLFAFSTVSPFLTLVWPADSDDPGTELVLDYFGLSRLEYDDRIEFQLRYGDWLRLFRDNGLIVEELIETRPRPEATSSYRGERHVEWSRRWPAENIWKARKAAR